VSSNRGLVIEKVNPNSIAEEIELAPGDKVISINGKKIEDLIDYQYMCADEYLELYVIKKNGEEIIFELEKNYDEDLGLVFAAATFDGIHPCQNRCLFCFVDQMPKGMRPSLYIKDDDYRLSFIHGNFVTLTNLTESDVKRIISLHLSPLYVSVHATDPEVRKLLLGNPNAGKILEQLEVLASAGIQMHTQIVLCPGINDGKILDKSIQDLAKLYPNVLSLAVVPVGLTKFREGLFELDTFNYSTSRDVLRQITNWQKKLLPVLGTRFVFPADEFYMLADIPVPSVDDYEGFPQLENGVGLVRLFLEEFYEYENAIPEFISKKRSISIAYGLSPSKILSKLVDRLNQVKNLTVYGYPIPHRFWGEKVTVTGLLTGSDLIAELKGKKLGDTLYISEAMVRKEGGLFLDNMTVEEVASLLNVKIDVTLGIKDLLKKIFKEDMECLNP